MSGLVGLHTSAEGASHKGQVTEEVEHFVACGLVFPLQGTELEESEMRGVAVRCTEGIGKFVKVGLCHRTVIDDEGIAQVTATDESHLQQWGNLTYEDEGTCRCKVGGKARKVAQLRTLCGNQFRTLEINGGVDAQSRRRGKGRRLGNYELLLLIVASMLSRRQRGKYA